MWCTLKAVAKEFASLDQFLQTWTDAGQKKLIIEELEKQGVLFEALAEDVGKDFDAFDPVNRRQIVYRRVEPQGQVDGLAVLHNEHLARTPGRRALGADAPVVAGTVVIDDDHAGHSGEDLITRPGAALFQHGSRDVGGGLREALQIGWRDLPGVDRGRGRLRRACLSTGAVDGAVNRTRISGVLGGRGR